MVKSTANAENKVLAEHLDLVMTAYHEAGHVICGLLHAFKIDAVHVFHNPKHQRVEGLTFYDDSPRPNQKWLHSEFCVSYAGMVAETILFRQLFGTETLPMVLKDGSSDDIWSAGKLMRKYKVGTPGKGRLRLKKKIIQETTKDLTKHWEEVIIIAHALIQKRHLYLSDVKALLTKKSKNKNFWKRQLKKLN